MIMFLFNGCLVRNQKKFVSEIVHIMHVHLKRFKLTDNVLLLALQISFKLNINTYY